VTRVAVLDYGMGNLRSVEKALERVGAAPLVTSDPRVVREANGVILPGVGAFPKAMERIRELGLDELVRERVEEGVPTLGICLGMQLLFDSSSELGGARGLGQVEGQVDRLGGDLKLPQIGWNAVSWRGQSPLVEGLPDPCPMYHVHTYAPRPGREEDVLGTATYGEEFVTAVERRPLYGVQFHPEKSGPHGLRLLSNFTRICSGALRAAA
jgi:imidazole glycerol-phosphate synthase subunit HisH